MDTQSHSNFGEVPVGGSERRFPWGCLLGGCLSVLVLMLVGVVATGFFTYRFYKGQLVKYTADQPKDLPVVELPPEELAAIEKRIEEFRTLVEEGKSSDELVLTSEDINALIAKDEKLKGKVFVRIEEQKVTADVSIPTDSIPGGKGRYFNGSVGVNVELQDGVLMVTVDDAEVNGMPVPQAVMEGFRKENLAKEMYKDVDTAKQLARIEKIEIGNNRIVLKVRKDEQAEPNNEQAENSAQAENSEQAGAERATEPGEVEPASGDTEPNDDTEPDGDTEPSGDAAASGVAESLDDTTAAEASDASAFEAASEELASSDKPVSNQP